MKNKFNLSDTVIIKGGIEQYKIIGMQLSPHTKPKKIWYDLYRLCDGYVCVIAESGIIGVS